MIPFYDLQKINKQHEEDIFHAVQRVIKSGWYLRGQETLTFENHYANFIGTNFAVGVGNGLEAIEMIFRAYIQLGVLKIDDEVIMPANTFIASVLAVLNAQLKPVLVDADPHTLLMDQNAIEQAISNKTKAVMIVHLYGKCAYSNNIQNICNQHGLLLVEDNAQAHGCRFHQWRTGALGDAAAHSFYPTKNLGALGDAGAVTTNNPQLAQIIRDMANYGFREKYYADVPGKNTRIDEVQAAVLDVKLNYLDMENERRKHLAALYAKYIDNPIVRIPMQNAGQDNVFHLFPILSHHREELKCFLANNGVQTLIHYPVPPHRQKALPQFKHLSMPISESIARQELSLPISPVITDEEVMKIANLVNLFKL